MNVPVQVPARTTSTTALISLIFGIVCWIALPFLGAVVAIVCGHIARGEIHRAPPGSLDGDGMAIAGLVLGYAHLAVILGVILMFFGVIGGLAYFGH
jgi:hypothetical protein